MTGNGDDSSEMVTNGVLVLGEGGEQNAARSGRGRLPVLAV